MTPGREVAGVVDAVGTGVDPGWIGRPAVGHLGLASGGYAELALAPAVGLHDLPELRAEVAVAAIGTGRTAVGILEQAAIGPDDVVLVTAAAGGLGGLFLQGARAAGAVAVGAAGGAEKVAAVRALGADVAVDYLEPAWPDRSPRPSASGGSAWSWTASAGELARAALELLGPGGRILLFGLSSGEPTRVQTSDLMRLGITASWALGGGIADRMRELETKALAEAAAGRLVAVVGRRFPLAQAAEAHRAIEARETMGKVVLLP
jgi:NADPH2:quinone reductase